MCRLEGKRPPSSESLQRDKSSSADVHRSKEKSEKPQSPPNPFIFPSTFQGSVMDTEVRPEDEDLRPEVAKLDYQEGKG